jgi:hypothetical protein
MSKSDEQLKSELAAAGIETTTIEKAAPSAKRVPSPKAEKEPKEPKAPRVKIPAGSKPSVVLAHHITDEEALIKAARLNPSDPSDKSALANIAGKIDKLAKKVGEKAVNLLRYRSQPDSVQVYTRMGLNRLIENGEVTSKDLVTMFNATYRPGTARAQSSQLMQLFPALDVATKTESGALRINKSSSIVRDFTKNIKA